MFADEDEKPEGEQTEAQESTEGAESEAPKKKSNMLLFIIIGVVILLGAGGFVAWKFFLHKPEEPKKEEAAEAAFDPKKAGFLELTEMLVNLRSVKAKGNMLKVSLTLELMDKKDETKIKEFEPLIGDACLTFLREQSVIDLEGGGIERIRQELLIRINDIVKPLRIHKIMFRDFFVQ